MSPDAIARLLAVVAELLAVLMRRYGTDDPVAAAEAFIRAEAKRAQIERAVQARHAARLAKRG